MARRSAGPFKAAQALILALLPFAVAPANAVEQLRGALAKAHRNNPVLNADRARQRADDEAVPQALAGFRPTITGSGNAGIEVARTRPTRTERREIIQDALNNIDPDDPNSATQQLAQAYRQIRPRTATTRSADGDLNITQTLFDGYKTASSVGSAESQVLAGRQALRLTEQLVLLAAATAYLDIVQGQANVELERKNIVFLEEIVRQARKRLELGDTTPTDLAQAEARLAGGRAGLSAAEADLVAARAAYRQAVGTEARDVPSTFTPEVDALVRMTQLAIPKELAAAVAVSLRDHPAVRAAGFEVDIAVYAVKVAQSALYPTVTAQGDLQGSYSHSTDPLVGTEIGRARSASVQAAIPIYDGGLASAQARQAKEMLAQARNDLETARDQVRADVTAAWSSLAAARAAVEAGRIAVEANEIALAGVIREQLEGQRTVLNVLNAQQELLSARLRLLQAQRDTVVGSFTLLAAVGRLSARKVGVIREEYQPQIHFDQVKNLWRGTRTPDGR